MGGGGVMRTAAKVGIAGGAAAAAGRLRHAAPAFATAPAAAAAPPFSVSGGEAAPAAAAQWGESWELDDWEFADWGDDAAAAVVVPERGASASASASAWKPRVVFAPPSREEAEEATTELRDAIERAYFNESPVEVVKEQDKDINNQAMDAIIPSMSGHVIQAFSLLKSSPEAQSVVASLVSDRNVWDAVLKNEKVMDFYKNHQTTLLQTFPEEAATVESPEKFEDAASENASHKELPPGSAFSDFVDNAKKKVMDAVQNITHFFQELFGDPAEAQAGAGSSAEKGPSFIEAIGGPFMALAIAAILVVLFKRA